MRTISSDLDLYQNTCMYNAKIHLNIYLKTELSIFFEFKLEENITSKLW